MPLAGTGDLSRVPAGNTLAVPAGNTAVNPRRDRRFRFGVSATPSASRNPSPIVLKASTVRASAVPETNIIH